MVLMTLSTTLVTPVALRLVFAGGPGEAGAPEAAGTAGAADPAPGGASGPEPAGRESSARSSEAAARGPLDAHAVRSGHY